MSLSNDLLEVARSMASPVGRSPRQAELRRAISTAYYALFHRLGEEAARRFVGTRRNRHALRESVFGRALDHTDMKECARGFLSGNPSAPYREALGGQAPGSALVRLAERFVELQEERHRADYHAGARFTAPRAVVPDPTEFRSERSV